MDNELPMIVIGAGPGVSLWCELAQRAGRTVTTTEPGWPGDDEPLEVSLVVAEWPGLSESDTTQQTHKLASALRPASVLAVFTETTPAAELAGSGTGSDRVVALRLVAASATPRLLEVIPSMATKPDALTQVHEHATALGFTTVQSPDLPGFLIDALLRPHLNLASRLLEEQVATAADLDKAVQLGLGYPIGPMGLLDRLGLDEHLAITDALYSATGEAKYQPPTLLRRMAAVGYGAGVAENTDGRGTLR